MPGHNRCKALAPELFKLDEYGNSRKRAVCRAAFEEKPYLVRSNCPEFAVEMIEDQGQEMSARPPVKDWATDFDYLDPRWINAPFPIWGEMRQRYPIAHTDRFGGAYLPAR